MLRVRRMGGERCVAPMKHGPVVKTLVAFSSGRPLSSFGAWLIS